jgi:hypothetical protein
VLAEPSIAEAGTLILIASNLGVYYHVQALSANPLKAKFGRAITEGLVRTGRGQTV